MSIASEITRIKNNISSAYDECALKGATMPAHDLEDSDHLANTISSITELRGQQVTIYEYSPIGTTFYPTGVYNGITQATTEMKRCDLSITPSTSAQTFDIFTIHQGGPPYPPEVINVEGLSGFETVSISAVDSTIDSNISSSNIKDGVTILGVTGDYVGEIGSLSVTPTTSQQTFRATYDGSTGYTGYAPVVVDAVTSSIDANITSGNIKDGVTILGVTGSYTGQQPNLGSLSVTPSTSSQTIYAYDDPMGYDGYDTVYVDAVDYTIDNNIQDYNIKDGVSILGVTGTLEELNADQLTITLDTVANTYTPTSPYNGFDSVYVPAVDYTIDSNITTSNIKHGVNILGVMGTYEGDIRSLQITPSTSQQVIDAQYDQLPTTGYSPITVNAVNSSIDSNITSGNIKNGVTILGVTGSYTGTSPVLISKNITQDGVYNAIDDNADGYSSVNVSVGGGVTPIDAMTFSGSVLTINKDWIYDAFGVWEQSNITVDLSNLQGQVQGQNTFIQVNDLQQAQQQSGQYTFYLQARGLNNGQVNLTFTQNSSANDISARVEITSYGWYPPMEFTGVAVYRPLKSWNTIHI